MKVKVAVVLGALFFLSQQIALGQQFILEWEWDAGVRYVGDMDGDGVGEFAISDNSTTQFYDGANHNLKWTTTGAALSYYWFQTDRNPYSVFPSIDYTGDGVREIIFGPTDYVEGVIIMDVVNDSIIFELSDPDAYEITLIALADVDGDDTLELVIYEGKPGSSKTYIYSTGVLAKVDENNPKKNLLLHKLNQNYPNPFNPITKIEYSIQQAGLVSIKVYNTAGQLVRTLVNENKKVGHYTVNWDGRDDKGNKVASGVYFYEMQAGDHRLGKKAIVLK